MTTPAPIWIPQSLALVDVSCIWKKNFMAYGGSDPRAAADRTLAELAAVRESVEHVILCCDAPPYTRRLAIYPEYKAQRTPVTEVEREQKKQLFAECKRLGYQIARVKGEEADDVIATLARIYGEMIPDVRLVGGDKDLAQCVTANVRQMVPPVGERPGELRGPERVLEKFGVRPDQIPMYLALVGDKSDNVPGVPDIGQVKAVSLINEFKTFFDLGEAVAKRPPTNGVWKALKKGWPSFEMSLALVMLKTNLEIDYNALLVPLDPEPVTEMAPGFEDAEGMTDGDRQTAEALLADIREMAPELRPRIGRDPNADEFLRQAHAERERLREQANRAEEEREEKWRREMREENEAAERDYDTRAAENAPANDKVSEAEFDPIGKSPGASGPLPPKPQAAKPTDIAAKLREYGLVDGNLQPLDLKAAEVISKWIHASQLYPQYRSAPAVFVAIMRGKELGIGVMTALAGFNVLGGKLSASADMIRSLATRSPKCKYLRRIHADENYAEWETWHADHPEPSRFRYTIDQARKAGLSGGQWNKIPLEMLSKTAASKLARETYPAETLGLYCPEEMGGNQYDEVA